MNKTFIYDGEGRIWDDVEKPEATGNFDDDCMLLQKWEAYNSRLSYPVHPELQKKWVKGQKVCRGIDYDLMSDVYTDGDGWNQWEKRTAIPLPESKPETTQPDEQLRNILVEYFECLFDGKSYEGAIKEIKELFL